MIINLSYFISQQSDLNQVSLMNLNGAGERETKYILIVK